MFCLVHYTKELKSLIYLRFLENQFAKNILLPIVNVPININNNKEKFCEIKNLMRDQGTDLSTGSLILARKIQQNYVKKCNNNEMYNQINFHLSLKLTN